MISWLIQIWRYLREAKKNWDIILRNNDLAVWGKYIFSTKSHHFVHLLNNDLMLIGSRFRKPLAAFASNHASMGCMRTWSAGIRAWVGGRYLQ